MQGEGVGEGGVVALKYDKARKWLGCKCGTRTVKSGGARWGEIAIRKPKWKQFFISAAHSCLPDAKIGMDSRH